MHTTPITREAPNSLSILVMVIGLEGYIVEIGERENLDKDHELEKGQPWKRSHHYSQDCQRSTKFLDLKCVRVAEYNL